MSVPQTGQKVGINSLANRLFYNNNEIPLNWLNMLVDTFKINCKKIIPLLVMKNKKYMKSP